jgi:hypothetical protein
MVAALSAAAPDSGKQRIIAIFFAAGLRQRFRQAHHIPQAEIKALPGDGMQRLRRVADQRQAMGNRRLRWSTPADKRCASRMGNTPQPPAKRLLQLGKNVRLTSSAPHRAATAGDTRPANSARATSAASPADHAR